MKISFLIIALSVAMLSTSASAQARTPRMLATGSSGGPGLRKSAVAISSDGNVKVTWDTISGKVVHTFASGVAAPGGYDINGGDVATRVLVAGRSGSAGLLERWEWSSGMQEWQLVDAYTLADADFVGVAHVDGHLYLLDCVSRSVLRALWEPTLQSISALQFSVAATENEIPSLASADLKYLLPMEQGDGPSLPGPGALVLTLGLDVVGQAGVLVYDALGSPVVTAYSFNPNPLSAFAVVDESQVGSGATSLVVSAETGFAFEVKRPDGAVIGSGLGSATGEVVVPLSEPLEVGVVYAITAVGGTYGTSFKCVARYGFPETFSDGTHLSRTTIPAVESVVGNSGFCLKASVVREHGGPRVGYSGLMILGFLGMPILNVDNGQGPNKLLDSEYWVGAGGFISENAIAGFVDMSFPIPANPSLEGLVLLAQFVIGDSAGLRLGEVIGFKIGPAFP